MRAELLAARAYAARGWSVLPMLLAEKRPRFRWKRYQRERASDSTVYRWFARTDYGVGAVFGQVSGGLASRDFDDAEAYHRWADAQRALATELPTIETRRGYHVYCCLWPESVQEARRRLGKPEHGRGAIALGDGELRAGVGCYSVLPPSTHPSGHVYRWAVPLPEGDLPWLDACDVGFCDFDARGNPDRFHGCNTAYTENTSNEAGSDEGGDDDSDPAEPAAFATLTVEEAIVGSLPTGRGQRHRQVFEFVRRLKAVSELADQPGTALRPYAEEWHRRAYAAIGTKPFEETWIDFLKAWENVRSPYGGGVLSVAFERACRAGLPDVTHDYDQPEVLLLAGLCRELQRAAGDRPFFLSCRDAGRLLGVSHVKASRWLFLLVADGVLEEVEKGDVRTRKASQYRYLG